MCIKNTTPRDTRKILFLLPLISSTIGMSFAFALEYIDYIAGGSVICQSTECIASIIFRILIISSISLIVGIIIAKIIIRFRSRSRQN